MEIEDNGGDVIQRTTDYSFGMRAPAKGTDEFPAVDGTLNITEDVIFLEPGEEKAQNIVKAMSHQNAGDIVQLLSLEGSLNMSDISERLNISLNAAKYHIDNLTHAGILENSNTRYSVKGKKIKIYRLKNQVFIVAPKMTSIAQVRTALMRYSAVFVVFVSVFCVAIIQSFVQPTVSMTLSGSMGSVATALLLNDNSIIPALITATAVTLLLFVLYEIHTHWKNQKACV
ncbi:MAG: helix-turn-helix domain-containing protein [Methanoregula sp.]|nr:helix-turn-helix domain-containing protein [Methanoregula sp.]